MQSSGQRSSIAAGLPDDSVASLIIVDGCLELQRLVDNALPLQLAAGGADGRCGSSDADLLHA